MLNDVVAKLIFCKDCDICENIVNYGPCLRLLAVFKDSLDYSTTIGVETKFYHILWMLTDWFNYEINSIIWHFFDALLNYMIAILIIDTVKNRILKLLNQKFLLVQRYNFKSFLNNSTTIHGFRELQNITQELFSKSGCLYFISVFEKFLDNIVSKHIIHQTISLRQNLRENKLFFFFSSDIIFLLNESRSILVHGAFHDMILDVSYFNLLSILNLASKVFQEFAFRYLDNRRHCHIVIKHIISLLLLLLWCSW